MATFAESLLAAWDSAAPTEVGRAEAMLAKMSTDVPLPSLSSVMVSAICSRATWSAHKAETTNE